MTNWMREARAATWWLTKDDLDWPDEAREKEIVRRAARLAGGGVNVAILFGLHFRWDFVPYFERIGLLVRRIADECHRHGIRLCDHYSDTLIHRPRNEADRRFIRERLNHHVPIYPDADQDYAFEGSFRNSWRMVDARTNAPVWFEPYRCEIFCPNNPDYQRASVSYARRQFEQAGIDGLMNDDLHFLPDYHSCACVHCRERFRAEYNRELPPATENAFWGNRDNPAFRDWLAMRLRSIGDHYARLRRAIGPERPLFGCCCETASPVVSDRGMVHDEFSRGCNVVSIEMVGVNPVAHWRSHYASQTIFQAIAAAGDFLRGEAGHILDVREPDPFLALAYAETPDEFAMAWAMQVAWGARSWVCRRTGTTDRYDDESHFTQSLQWEAAHRDLYRDTRRVADVGVVFSPATRNFAPIEQAKAHRTAHLLWTMLMAEHGILSEALLAPALRGRDAGKRLAERYQLLLLPSIVVLEDSERDGLAAFEESGGKSLATESLPIEATAPGAFREGEIYHDPSGRKPAIQECRAALIERLPQRLFRPCDEAGGWQFNLYRRGQTHFLHYLNLSGARLLDGQIVRDDPSLRFEIPSSGFIECVLRLETSHRWKAELCSPQGAESEVVETRTHGTETHLRIPVARAARYGIVRIQPHN